MGVPAGAGSRPRRGCQFPARGVGELALGVVGVGQPREELCNQDACGPGGLQSGQRMMSPRAPPAGGGSDSRGLLGLLPFDKALKNPLGAISGLWARVRLGKGREPEGGPRKWCDVWLGLREGLGWGRCDEGLWSTDRGAWWAAEALDTAPRGSRAHDGAMDDGNSFGNSTADKMGSGYTGPGKGLGSYSSSEGHRLFATATQLCVLSSTDDSQ